MGNFIYKKKSKNNFYIEKPKIYRKKYKLNTKPVKVRFITYDGEEVLNYKPKYSYTYKGIPGGFY